MIDFAKVKPGDKLRIVGAGAPGYAQIGDLVTVTACNGHNRVDVQRAAGEPAYFALTCGAARLEPAHALLDRLAERQLFPVLAPRD